MKMRPCIVAAIVCIALAPTAGRGEARSEPAAVSTPCPGNADARGAHHTFAHPLLDRMPLAAAEAEIDRGFAAVDGALYGSPGRSPRTPFFRFPGFASSPALLDRLERREIVVFGADLWASDWNPMSSGQQLALVLGRIEALGGGIVLFHDTKAQTAAMIPALLRSLRQRGFRVVHAVSRR